MQIDPLVMPPGEVSDILGRRQEGRRVSGSTKHRHQGSTPLRHYVARPILVSNLLFHRVGRGVEDKQEVLVPLTNLLHLSAAIAAIHKRRWQIERFSRALEQNLRIKTFVGTSADAIHLQTWTALVALLLLKCLQVRSRCARALSHRFALLRCVPSRVWERFASGLPTGTNQQRWWVQTCPRASLTDGIFCVASPAVLLATGTSPAAVTKCLCLT